MIDFHRGQGPQTREGLRPYAPVGRYPCRCRQEFLTQMDGFAVMQESKMHIFPSRTETLARTQTWLVRSLLCVPMICAGCAGRAPYSFQTLGVPEPSPRGNRAALVIGWRHDGNEGWSASRIRVDGRVRAEWRAETQQPAVIYLTPGTRTLRVYLVHSDEGTRLRLRPLQLDLESGETHLCELALDGRNRRRPRVRCAVRQRRARPDASAVRERAVARPRPRGRRSSLLPNPFHGRSVRGAGSAANDENGRELLSSPYPRPLAPSERLERIEERLDRLEELLQEILTTLEGREND